jgi:hypothetical protein
VDVTAVVVMVVAGAGVLSLFGVLLASVYIVKVTGETRGLRDLAAVVVACRERRSLGKGRP